METIFIPIGSNCSVAYFLRKFNLRHIAFPFDWNCSSLKSIVEVLSNNFEGFLENLFIGEKTNRLYFNEDDNNLKISNDFIYPIICKKYNILFPHDFNKIDDNALLEVKQKYYKRIQRFNDIISMNNIKIVLVYSNIDFILNDFQYNVYEQYNFDILTLQNNNKMYIDKILEIYKNKPNISIMSLDELQNIYY